jgi:integrase
LALYQRGENWYIDFRFKGQRIRESIGPSRKDAEKIIAKKKTEIVENKYLDIRKEPDPIKFHEFAKEYLQWAKTNKKTSTYSRDVCIMRGFDKEFEGKYIHEITTWQIDGWKSKRSKVCKVATVNRELALLKHMFSMAVKPWKKLKESPAKDVKHLKGETRRVRYLMPDEIQKLLSNCDGLLRGLLKPLVTVALHTGARKGELQNLQWPQVDFDKGIISLLDTKNGERRDIPMNETVKATLKAMEKTGEFVFPNRNEKRIDNAQIQISFCKAIERSGIKDFHFHDLRHTFASNLVMEGVELNDVRELLGHKKMDMTLRYAHLSPKHKAKVVSILDRLLSKEKMGWSQNSPQVGRVVNLNS